MMIKPTLLIIGGKSVALKIRDTIEYGYNNCYSSVINVIGDEESPECSDTIRDFQLLQILNKGGNFVYIIGFSNPNLRKKYQLLLKPKFKEVSIIHPTAVVSPSAQIGTGIYIGANVVISSNAILKGSSLINFNATIGHDAVIGENCTINPGARISGHDIIGDNVLIGANAFIFQGVSIGNDTQVDALTYIRKDIGSNKVCTSNFHGCKVFDRYE